MAPTYMLENRYTFMEDLRRVVARDFRYEAESPQSEFEWEVQCALSEARVHHFNEEFRLALNGYEKLRALILRIANPQLPSSSTGLPGWQAPSTIDMLSVLIKSSVYVLLNSPRPLPDFPPSIVDPRPFPDTVQKQLDPYINCGVGKIAGGDIVAVDIKAAVEAVGVKNWAVAEIKYAAALAALPETDGATRGYLLRDIAIVEEKRMKTASALKRLQAAEAIFAKSKNARGQFDALCCRIGILERSGKTAEAGTLTDTALALAKKLSLNEVLVESPRGRGQDITAEKTSEFSAFAAAGSKRAAVSRAVDLAPYTVATLKSHALYQAATPQPSLTILDGNAKPITIALGSKAESNGYSQNSHRPHPSDPDSRRIEFLRVPERLCPAVQFRTSPKRRPLFRAARIDRRAQLYPVQGAGRKRGVQARTDGTAGGGGPGVGRARTFGSGRSAFRRTGRPGGTALRGRTANKCN